MTDDFYPAMLFMLDGEPRVACIYDPAQGVPEAWAETNTGRIIGTTVDGEPLIALLPEEIEEPIEAPVTN